MLCAWPLSEEQNESSSCYPASRLVQGKSKPVLWEKVAGRVAMQFWKSLLPERSLIFLVGLQKGHLVMYIPNTLDLEVVGQARL